MDLDEFKAYNDTHGHPAGDTLLRSIGTAMASTVREGDRLYRYGGDEFAVLLPATDRGRATSVAERIGLAVDAYSGRRSIAGQRQHRHRLLPDRPDVDDVVAADWACTVSCFTVTPPAASPAPTIRRSTLRAAGPGGGRTAGAFQGCLTRRPTRSSPASVVLEVNQARRRRPAGRAAHRSLDPRAPPHSRGFIRPDGGAPTSRSRRSPSTPAGPSRPRSQPDVPTGRRQDCLPTRPAGTAGDGGAARPPGPHGVTGLPNRPPRRPGPLGPRVGPTATRFRSRSDPRYRPLQGREQSPGHAAGDQLSAGR
jgi:hypothetical protein